jgi:hypothetical protein
MDIESLLKIYGMMMFWSGLASLFLLICNCFIYNKAGQPWWAAIVPVYNILVYLRIIGKPWWWILILIFVPVANVVFAIMMIHGLSVRFGHGGGFTVGLLFIPLIFYPILAFGSSEYNNKA